MIGAEAHVGPVDVELVQPVDGPSIYKEWLDEHGEGVHHIAVMRATMEDAAETEEYFEKLGAPVIMEGRIGESIRFFYVDAQPTLKVILESGSGHAVDMTPVRVYPPAGLNRAADTRVPAEPSHERHSSGRGTRARTPARARQLGPIQFRAHCCTYRTLL